MKRYPVAGIFVSDQVWLEQKEKAKEDMEGGDSAQHPPSFFPPPPPSFPSVETSPQEGQHQVEGKLRHGSRDMSRQCPERELCLPAHGAIFFPSPRLRGVSATRTLATTCPSALPCCCSRIHSPSSLQPMIYLRCGSGAGTGERAQGPAPRRGSRHLPEHLPFPSPGVRWGQR